MRGKPSQVGDTRTAPNGYHYTNTHQGWRLTHHILAEQIIGRPLREDERVEFKDKDRTNLSADNLNVVKKGESTKARTRARLTARIQELQAQLRELDD